MPKISQLLFAALIAAAVVATAGRTSAAFAASLDDLDPPTCVALDAQLARGSDAIALFNATSEAAVSAFKAGRHDEGCRGYLAVRRYVVRISAKLRTCAAALAAAGDAAAAAEDRTLLAGFADLSQQFERIERREACEPRS